MSFPPPSSSPSPKVIRLLYRQILSSSLQLNKCIDIHNANPNHKFKIRKSLLSEVQCIVGRIFPPKSSLSSLATLSSPPPPIASASHTSKNEEKEKSDEKEYETMGNLMLKLQCARNSALTLEEALPSLLSSYSKSDAPPVLPAPITNQQHPDDIHDNDEYDIGILPVRRVSSEDKECLRRTAAFVFAAAPFQILSAVFPFTTAESSSSSPPPPPSSIYDLSPSSRLSFFSPSLCRKLKFFLSNDLSFDANEIKKIIRNEFRWNGKNHKISPWFSPPPPPSLSPSHLKHRIDFAFLTSRTLSARIFQLQNPSFADLTTYRLTQNPYVQIIVQSTYFRSYTNNINQDDDDDDDGADGYPNNNKPRRLRSDQNYLHLYHITIENIHPTLTVQLIWRKWDISTSDVRDNETVNGKGVVGKQPILSPKQTFSYGSQSFVGRELGKMEGKFLFKVVGNGSNENDMEKGKNELEESQLIDKIPVNTTKYSISPLWSAEGVGVAVGEESKDKDTEGTSNAVGKNENETPSTTSGYFVAAVGPFLLSTQLV